MTYKELDSAKTTLQDIQTGEGFNWSGGGYVRLSVGTGVVIPSDTSLVMRINDSVTIALNKSVIVTRNKYQITTN